MRRIYVGGSFDCFHDGHRELLRDAYKIVGVEGRILVAVNSDAFFKRYKGFEPADDETTRLMNVTEYLSLLTDNSATFLIEQEEQVDVLLDLQPDFIIHGTDWLGESLAKNFGISLEWLEENNILLIYTDRRSGMSSSLEREKRKQ